MTHSERLSAFVRLGQFLGSLTETDVFPLATLARSRNPWFDEPSVRAALAATAHLLAEPALSAWAAQYPAEPATPRRVGVVMPGNVPLAGFHDVLCVLVSGHTLLARLSPDDTVLMHWLLDQLLKLEPRFGESLRLVPMLRQAEAYIASGDAQAARNFETYFSAKPHLVRRHRYGLAVLAGPEAGHELAAFGPDIFQYYGLSHRNLSRLLVPAGYDFTPLLDALQPWATVLDQNRYNNNYDYQKSLLLVNRVPHLDTGFLLLTESERMVTSISVLHYSEYRDEIDLSRQLAAAAPDTEVVASVNGWWPGSVAAGHMLRPAVTDYPANLDTMAFLAALA